MLKIFGKYLFVDVQKIANLNSELIKTQSEGHKLRQKLNFSHQENDALKNENDALKNENDALKNESVFFIENLPNLGEFSSYSHDRSKKQILVLGWYGASNYGDELMLSVLLQKIRVEEAEISIVFEPNARYNLNQWGECFAYYPPSSTEDFEKITDFFDEVILGGGAHIDDSEWDDLGFIPFLALNLSILAINKQKIVRWVGVSSNKELHRLDYIEKIKFIAEHAKEFSIRDKYSIDTLKSIGIDFGVTLVDDLALEVNPNNKIMGVTLMDNCGLDALVKIVKEIVDFVRKDEKEWSICFLPFYNGNHHDVKMYEWLEKYVELKGVSYFIAPEFKNVDSMLMMLRGCNLFINMRYHASLLSLLHQIPTLTICLDSHPHYFNKIHYIHEYFNNEFVINISEMRSGQIITLLQKLNSRL